MLKKILTLLILICIFKIDIVKGEVTYDYIIEELNNSNVVLELKNNNHNINIEEKKNIIEIKDEYNNNIVETIFKIENNYLEFSSSEEKEILASKAFWIEEITKILLKYNKYTSEDINNFDISKYSYSTNGIEGVRNIYVKDNQEFYYYFYYKVNLEKIELEKKEDINLKDDTTNNNDNDIIKEKTTSNNISTSDKKKTINYPLLIELFCIVIGVIMLFISESTKNSD